MAKAKKQAQPPYGATLTFDEFSSPILRLCVSPEGTRLAVSGEEDPGEVLVVELPSGARVARYTGLAERPGMAFRSESELILAHGRDCRLCDLATNSDRAVPLPGDLQSNAWLFCCRASPDGKIALGGGRLGGLLLLDPSGGNEPRCHSTDASIHAIHYSPDGRLVALVVHPSEGERWWQAVRVLGTEDGKRVCDLKLPERQGEEYAPGFHPDNRTLAVGWNSNVLLFDLSPPTSRLDPEVLFGEDWTGYPMGWGRPKACYPLGCDTEKWWQRVSVLRFSADGSVLKVLLDYGEAVLLSTDEGRVLQRTPPPGRGDGFGADISPTGRAAVRVGDKEVATWEVPWWGKG